MRRLGVFGGGATGAAGACRFCRTDGSAIPDHVAAEGIMPENRLWDLAHQVIRLEDRQDVVVTRSSHSIDILAPTVSKLNVLRRMREDIGDTPILTIRDRGRWPGNDYELLREPFALSVDEISVDPQTCWNLTTGVSGAGRDHRLLGRSEVKRGSLFPTERAQMIQDLRPENSRANHELERRSCPRGVSLAPSHGAPEI